MTAFVSLFMIIWFHAGNGYGIQRFISNYGRMSLTNYIGQSIIGVAVYYHFGLNLWCRTGAFESLLIGAAIFALQLLFSNRWLASHRQGPLEYLWKKGTWLGSQKV